MNIGDKVLILVDRVPGTGLIIYPDTVGVVEDIDTDTDTIRVEVPIIHPTQQTIRKRAYGRSWLFSQRHLQQLGPSMTEPEFDLDDMELAEIIMEELSHEDQ